MNHRRRSWRIALLAVPYVALLVAASVLFGAGLWSNPETGETGEDFGELQWPIGCSAALWAGLVYTWQAGSNKRQSSGGVGRLIAGQIVINWGIVVAAAFVGPLFSVILEDLSVVGLEDVLPTLMLTWIYGLAALPVGIVTGLINSIIMAAATAAPRTA